MSTLTASLFVPPHNPATELLTELAGTLRERSMGRLTLEVAHSARLASTEAQFDAACSGVVDIAYMIQSATPGRFPLTELAQLPFAARDARSATEALLALLPSCLAQEYPGVKVLFLAANCPMAIHAAAPLRSLRELEGRRIGHTGRVIGATLAALGAVPVTVMPLEVPAALAEGRIDGASMTYEAALVTRLAQSARYSFDLNANTITFGLVMNAARHAALPPESRRHLDEILGAAAGRQLAGRLVRAAEDGKRYMREAGVVLAVPDAADREAVRTLCRPVIERLLAETPQGKKFHEAFVQHQMGAGHEVVP